MNWLNEVGPDFPCEHRMEYVATIRDVTYINDSKATNVNSTWFTLSCYEGPIVWICGGMDKGNNYDILLSLVREKVRLIICLGKNNIKIHEAFGNMGMIVNTASAKEAAEVAFRFSEPNDTVLLSPSCASFDLFENYEDRGRQFKDAVRDLSF